jgi:subtilisin family serine protease
MTSFQEMQPPGAPPPAQEKASPGSSCAGSGILILAWLWAAGLAFTYTAQSVFLASFGPEQTRAASAGTAAGYALLLFLPLGILALFWKAEPFRSILRAWSGAALFALLAAPIHLALPYSVQLRAVLHVPAAGIFILLVWLLAGAPRISFNKVRTSKTWLLALLPAIFFSYPWLAFGALGSPLDTLTHLLAALASGAAVAFLMEVTLLPWLSEPATGRVSLASRFSHFLLGGVAVGTTIVVFSSGMGFGYFGMQLLLMLSLPALGFAAAGIARLHRQEEKPEGASLIRFLNTAGLIGLGAAAPMTLISPRDLYLVIGLGPGEIWTWGLAGAVLSALSGALVSGIIFFALSRGSQPLTVEAESGKAFSKPVRSEARTSGLFLVIAAALTSVLLIYLPSGRAGFHSDTLFVIMAEQADLSLAPMPGVPEDSRQQVYELLTAHAARTQARLRSSLDRLNIAYTPFYILNGLEVHGGPLLLAWLNTRPDVDRVLLNPWMRPLPAERSPTQGASTTPPEDLWNLEAVQANRVWQEFGVTGEGIVIGQSDSGVDWEHPGLTASYRGWGSGQDVSHDYNWFDPWYHEPLPVDFLGHGTHTLGSILGEGIGVAPEATWYGCANLSRNMGNPALYLGCMQFMLAPFPVGGDPFTQGRPDMGAHIVNNSWGCPEVEGCDPTSLEYAIHALRQAGIFVVVSAGNDGPFCGSLNHPPAIYGQAFSVGAVDRQGDLASFSSIGPVTADGSGRVKPDLVAPGVNVVSAMPGGTYSPLSGTSMAGPHVSGVVALMWSANPSLIGDIDRTEALLIQSASTYTGRLPDCTGAGQFPSTAAGYGVLNAYAAVRLALEDASP